MPTKYAREEAPALAMPKRTRQHKSRHRLKRMGTPRSVSDKRYDETTRTSDASLAEAKRIRSTARWQRVRLRKLRRHPLCERCELFDRVRVADQVHHVVGLREDPSLAFTPANLMSVCTACHAQMEAQERKHAKR